MMRIVKERTKDMVPGLKCFLDVDDLSGGKGADQVSSSSVVLVLAAEGYFTSINCLRELLVAMVRSVPVIALLDGSLSVAKIRKLLSQAERDLGGKGPWGGLAKEDSFANQTLPSARAIFEALCEVSRPLEWSKVKTYQDTTLRLVVERLLEVRLTARKMRLANQPKRQLVPRPRKICR